MLELHLSKQSMKFSAAHTTVFPDGSRERLHGHNYHVSCTLELHEFSFIPFAQFKKIVKQCCEAWDEKVLLPAKCRFFKLKADSSNEMEFTLCDRRYVLPKEDVELLPVENITSEELSRLLAEKISKEIQVKKIKVTVEETEGQGASYSYAPPLS